jgi:predicted nucleotidyltransferase
MPVSRNVEKEDALASYVQGWRERSRREAEAAAAWRKTMRPRIDAVVAMLVRDYGVSKVLLFGSFALAEAAPGSDVDLLVSGLGTEHIIDATVAGERILLEARLDLAPIDLARSSVRERAEWEGVLLYGG